MNNSKALWNGVPINMLLQHHHQYVIATASKRRTYLTNKVLSQKTDQPIENPTCRFNNWLMNKENAYIKLKYVYCLSTKLTTRILNLLCIFVFLRWTVYRVHGILYACMYTDHQVGRNNHRDRNLMFMKVLLWSFFVCLFLIAACVYPRVYKWQMSGNVASGELGELDPGPCLNIKTVFPRNGDSHVKDKTVVRPSYL